MDALDYNPDPELAERIRGGIAKHLDEVNPPSSLDDDALCLLAQGFGAGVAWAPVGSEHRITMTPSDLRRLMRAEASRA